VGLGIAVIGEIDPGPEGARPRHHLLVFAFDAGGGAGGDDPVGFHPRAAARGGEAVGQVGHHRHQRLGMMVAPATEIFFRIGTLAARGAVLRARQDHGLEFGIHLHRHRHEMHTKRRGEQGMDLRLGWRHGCYSSTIFGAGRCGVWSAAATFSATARNAAASGPSGSATATGVPVSESSRIFGPAGFRPGRGAASAAAVSRAPPWPKMGCAWPQFSQTNIDMFSTIPRMGTFTFWNMTMALRASIRAMSCGVETITAPVSATRWVMVSWASPVPGGMSSTRTSISSWPAAAQSTWVRNCISAD